MVEYTRNPDRRPRIVLVATAIILGVAAQGAVRLWRPVSLEESAPLALKPAIAAPISAAESATDEAIRFYCARVQRDPLEARSQTALAESYLQRARETGNEDALLPALAAARASLEAVPAARNAGGLMALAHAEFANHAFAAARQRAQELIELDPSKGEAHAILGDAALELGDYEAAAAAFEKMKRLQPENPGTETRLARHSIIRGKTAEAQNHFQRALTLLRELHSPPNETISWCLWQLGETAFGAADYALAESYQRQALATSPGYFRALGSLGRVRAARGDLAGGISFYEEAARVSPAIDYMAALGDLYTLAGRERDAAIRFDLVEQLGEHSRKIHGTPYDRKVALFLADHDRKLEQAYALARGEFEAGRHDVYGADALAWTAWKSGHLAAAQTAKQEALRLGTRDARFFYHAGRIAQGAGDQKNARVYLERALALSPMFDLGQSQAARGALEKLP